jgi:hypothetical protein
LFSTARQANQERQPVLHSHLEAWMPAHLGLVTFSSLLERMVEAGAFARFHHPFKRVSVGGISPVEAIFDRFDRLVL